jgi:hypothetical protein
VLLLVVACGGSDADAPSNGAAQDTGARGIEPAGQTCATASQCYGGVDGGAILGTVTCLTKVTNGYCTHTCTQDTDCCAAPGECLTGVKEVCSPLENQGAQYCFLSCEDADVQRTIAANGDALGIDASTDAYCQTFAGASTTCRSTGGGSKNRKTCLP